MDRAPSFNRVPIWWCGNHQLHALHCKIYSCHQGEHAANHISPCNALFAFSESVNGRCHQYQAARSCLFTKKSCCRQWRGCGRLDQLLRSWACHGGFRHHFCIDTIPACKVPACWLLQCEKPEHCCLCSNANSVLMRAAVPRGAKSDTGTDLMLCCMCAMCLMLYMCDVYCMLSPPLFCQDQSNKHSLTLLLQHSSHQLCGECGKVYVRYNCWADNRLCSTCSCCPCI